LGLTALLGRSRRYQQTSVHPTRSPHLQNVVLSLAAPQQLFTVSGCPSYIAGSSFVCRKFPRSASSQAKAIGVALQPAVTVRSRTEAKQSCRRKPLYGFEFLQQHPLQQRQVQGGVACRKFKDKHCCSSLALTRRCTGRTRLHFVPASPPVILSVRQEEMNSNRQTDSFWSGGSDSISSRLDAEEAEALQPLLAELKATKDRPSRKIIKERIKAIKAEYKKKRRDLDSMLFFGKINL